MNAAAKQYSAAEITVLEGLEPVRVRPSMYIGSTDSKGLHHLVWEIVDNAVDEYLNGHADTITVTLHRSLDAVTVQDNGRGIPVDLHPKHNRPALELILTTLHSGAKFGEGDSYIHSGGLHGVGSSVVNALSRRLVATIRRDGFEWNQTFSRGLPISTLQRGNPTRQHGTMMYFEPDEQIFRTTRMDADWIRSHLDDMAYIHSKLKIFFKNEATGETFDLAHPGGLGEFLQRLIRDGQKPTITDSPFLLSKSTGEKIEVALQWTDSTDESFRSYVNGIRTAMGGTHENGFRSAIVKAVRNYMSTHDIKTKGLEITAEDIREGVVGVLSVFVREPMFQGQTKERLNNPELTATVEGFVRPALETWLNGNPSAADSIIGRIIMAARARLASREAVVEVKRKSVTSRRLNLPGKLADCKSSELDETELFIVEGDSAGGSAKQGRNNKTQAVLPLRGKILNGEGLSTAKVLQNSELHDLVSAIGTGAGDKFNLAGLRYGKIILLMDADADGHHISTLLMDFFFRHMPELIRKGHVYLAQPPLYRINIGKETQWARDDAHKEAILAKLRANAKPEITRFKGLGEMDAKVLGETTLDPRYRTLLKVQIDSNLDADQTFDHLLGKEAAHRYRFIMREAEKADLDDLDV
ncbi:DNA gyrase/topoisomerase IV subunit B [Tuwongella immobilis]|uniref:DNA topoisomerase (ATP-hydrolyzing) n=1 Tax=Tuwongella immobilis TaxID=692036 RepID=A0A6C2YLQ3_9BACT|nr:DNA topoisomerase IV subunit B [Tuwongella immobilis]VIP02304.1 dna topoisomerase iv subunit b : DNA gyrase subunit B OS=uncultured planctomycete GN=HGMM_F22C11C07 PE=3 SV=1: HATPase_c: DNA_gyraseB: Toprim: DNA_gyraseB_C [Tuwongella immobilis]VTS00998.1 dna topoisomerase iv subunit b : DNA gyrase subunit B OS=uncultured planctomycete GN=HGMM_F22C11C07 PE=3 SV=1: HATPase_c: DNA_gyraseB: Toprim: DNA_gyraseB_C [Tuwongella immobilis]